MKKKVWIFNHYSGGMYKNQGGRHYWFAENLIKRGYDPTVFCASVLHNRDEKIDIEVGKYKRKTVDEIPFVFVETPEYDGNRVKRVNNMIQFYRNLFPVSKEYSGEYGKPDIILASSVHPLTMVAGIKIAKKFGIPCICEVRDLWPESVVAYGILKKEGLVAKSLYKGEKWIYKNADSIVMTWEGGKDYIIDQGWEDEVSLSKIEHISNGVVVDSFDRNSEEFIIEDEDLENKDYKNIVYAGSIRKVNKLGMLLDAAKVILDKGRDDIRFLIYGSGNEVDTLKQRCVDEGISNVIFKGRVNKKYIPSILKKSYINILHNESTSLNKYGQSQNKFFEYLASGRCVIQTYKTGYNIIERYNCGYVVQDQTPGNIAGVIMEAADNEELTETMGENAREAAHEFDFEKLTDKLIDVIENTEQL